MLYDFNCRAKAKSVACPGMFHFHHNQLARVKKIFIDYKGGRESKSVADITIFHSGTNLRTSGEGSGGANRGEEDSSREFHFLILFG